MIDTEPSYNRLFLFSPFHKTQVGVSVILDSKIPNRWSFKTFQQIANYNNGEPVIPIYGVENRKVNLELRNIKGETVKKQILEDLSIPIPTGIIMM